MSYLRRRSQGERIELTKFLEVPLADELFETMQGFFGPYARPMDEIEAMTSENRKTLLYHTYVNTVAGTLDDSDVVITLRLAFESYLRRLREHVQPNIQKPVLFWRFRRGNHIMLESNGKKRDPLVKLYTRLVVPSCSLIFCDRCLHTEGEQHAPHCDNIVRNNNA